MGNDVGSKNCKPCQKLKPITTILNLYQGLRSPFSIKSTKLKVKQQNDECEFCGYT